MPSPVEVHDSEDTRRGNRKLNDYLKIEAISAYLGLNVKTLYAMVESSSIPHYRIGRLIRFKKEDIDLWMEAKKVADRNPLAKSKRIFRSRSRNQYIDNIIRKTIDGLTG